MITITVSTTGIAPNAAGNPAEAHSLASMSRYLRARGTVSSERKEMDGFTPAKPLVINGTREMLSEGIRSLESMQLVIGEGEDVAEIRIYENTPIEAIVSIEEGGGGIIIDTQTWRWNGEAWLRP